MFGLNGSGGENSCWRMEQIGKSDLLKKNNACKHMKGRGNDFGHGALGVDQRWWSDHSGLVSSLI